MLVNDSWIRAQPNWSLGVDGYGRLVKNHKTSWISLRVIKSYKKSGFSYDLQSIAFCGLSLHRNTLFLHTTARAQQPPLQLQSRRAVCTEPWDRISGHCAMLREKGAHGDSTFDTWAIHDLVRILVGFLWYTSGPPKKILWVCWCWPQCISSFGRFVHPVSKMKRLLWNMSLDHSLKAKWFNLSFDLKSLRNLVEALQHLKLLGWAIHQKLK